MPPARIGKAGYLSQESRLVGMQRQKHQQNGGDLSFLGLPQILINPLLFASQPRRAPRLLI